MKTENRQAMKKINLNKSSIFEKKIVLIDKTLVNW